MYIYHINIAIYTKYGVPYGQVEILKSKNKLTRNQLDDYISKEFDYESEDMWRQACITSVSYHWEEAPRNWKEVI
tara:strand:- start:66 stop:290 length:225 start_codon:yes stop_codon:yes gene_type:complete